MIGVFFTIAENIIFKSLSVCFTFGTRYILLVWNWPDIKYLVDIQRNTTVYLSLFMLL